MRAGLLFAFFYSLLSSRWSYQSKEKAVILSQSVESRRGLFSAPSSKNQKKNRKVHVHVSSVFILVARSKVGARSNTHTAANLVTVTLNTALHKENTTIWRVMRTSKHVG